MSLGSSGIEMRRVAAAAASAIAVLGLAGPVANAASCQVAAAHTPSPAEKAYLTADYDKAVGLYRGELAQHVSDPALTAGLARVLLRQQKFGEAGDAVGAALKAEPKSAVLLTAKAEVEMRAGVPWEAAQTVQAAMQADPCLPRVHLVFARIADLNSLYAEAEKHLVLAHKLDPYDPEIASAWIGTLPLKERIAELERFASSENGEDAEDKHRTELYLATLKKRRDEPPQPCRLVSTTESTEIALGPLLENGLQVRAYGLDLKLNQKSARLEIDTGAGGVIVSKSVADRAGLKPYSQTEIGGIGDQGSKGGYVAIADSIRVGNLEFHNCPVRVVANNRMTESDGLIGMDMFSRFLVTLNYPDRKLALGPLPVRPGEAAKPLTLGSDADDESDDASKADGKGDAQKDKAAGGDAPASAPAAKTASPAASRGPHNRYIAPEMKDYTPVYREGHMLMLPVALNNSKLKLFIMDTGAWATNVSPTAAREVTKVYSDDSHTVHGLSGKVDKVYSAEQITFTFANARQKIDRVPAFDTSGVSRNLGLEISGFLGARTLELTTIHIDYRDGLVKFDYDPKKAPRARGND